MFSWYMCLAVAFVAAAALAYMAIPNEKTNEK